LFQKFADWIKKDIKGSFRNFAAALPRLPLKSAVVSDGEGLVHEFGILVTNGTGGDFETI
jgi:hypothetical protein